MSRRWYGVRQGSGLAGWRDEEQCRNAAQLLCDHLFCFGLFFFLLSWKLTKCLLKGKTITVLTLAQQCTSLLPSVTLIGTYLVFIWKSENASKVSCFEQNPYMLLWHLHGEARCQRETAIGFIVPPKACWSDGTWLQKTTCQVAPITKTTAAQAWKFSSFDL